VTGLAEKVELLHRRLEEAQIPHAFGGALALAYCIGEPRATADIDVNVFVAPTRARDVFAAMPTGVVTTEHVLTLVLDRGQVRVPWEDTPIDLFFAYHEFHEDVAGRTRTVPFGTMEIRVLDCGDLVVFKAIFGRPQDWVDIENVIESGGVDLDQPLRRLEALVGHDDPACRRLASIGAVTVDESEPYRRAFGSPRDQRG
jgi:hypothetical protein